MLCKLHIIIEITHNGPEFSCVHPGYLFNMSYVKYEIAHGMSSEVGMGLVIIKGKEITLGKDQDGGVGGRGAHLPPTNTSKIYLHMEKFLLKTNGN